MAVWCAWGKCPRGCQLQNLYLRGKLDKYMICITLHSFLYTAGASNLTLASWAIMWRRPAIHKMVTLCAGAGKNLRTLRWTFGGLRCLYDWVWTDGMLPRLHQGARVLLTLPTDCIVILLFRRANCWWGLFTESDARSVISHFNQQFLPTCYSFYTHTTVSSFCTRTTVVPTYNSVL